MEVVPPETIIKIIIKCRNPYTTRPPDGFFIVRAMNGENPYYMSSVAIPAMDTRGQFAEVVLSPTSWRPSTITNYLFEVSSSNSIAFFTKVDQLIVTLEHVELMANYSFQVVEGITMTDPYTVTNSSNIIQIEGITQLANYFEFTIEGVRNPSLAATEASYTILTKHSDGYDGERIYSTFVMPCNFPCFSCLSPVMCTACFPEGDESFQGGESKHLFYASGRECVSTQPPSYI